MDPVDTISVGRARLAALCRGFRDEEDAAPSSFPKGWDEILALPLPARRAMVKLINIAILFTPAPLDEDEAKRLAMENELTEEEKAAFAKHFPNGLFGGIIPSDPKSNN